MRTMSPLTRRDALKLAAAGTSALAWPAFAAPVHTFKHGAFEIMVLSDGHLVLPANILGPESAKPEIETLLKQYGQGPDQFQPWMNLTLIRTPSDLILIDTGAGANFQPTAGKLSDNLAAAGVDADKITKVVFTHAHPDHIWGTIDDMNDLRFPNASYVLSEREWNFWMDPDLIKKMPEAMQPFAVGAQRNLGAIKDKMKTVKPGDEIVPGLRVLDTAGHTPGHISFELAGGDGLIVTGDAIPHAAVTFAHPDWRFGFDTIPDLAITNRSKLLDRAAHGKIKLLGYHWPYPGVGVAEPKDGGYRFVPIT